MKYSHKIEELKNDELKLVSDEAGTIDSVIITKEMIPWIINTLRGASFEDYNDEKGDWGDWRKQFADCTVLIGKDYFVKSTPSKRTWRCRSWEPDNIFNNDYSSLRDI